jgi:hypothetical protein
LDRDFIGAVDQSASTRYIDYLLAGSPSLDGETVVVKTVPAAAVDVEALAASPRTRLYTETGELNGAVDLRDFDVGLREVFQHWLAQGAHPREFIQAAREAASVHYYDHTCARSLQGLGGGMTETQFLNGGSPS